MQRKGAQPGQPQKAASSSAQPEKAQPSTPASTQATAAAH
jgi:hypothetical protein